MAKRELNEDERKISEKSLEVLAEETDHLKFLIDYNTLMIEKGLKSNYLEKLRGFKKQVKVDKDELVMKTATIEALKNQLENGVEEIVEKEVQE
jgi:hypothetical protein